MDEKSLERVLLSAESLLKAASSAHGGKYSSPINCSRAEKGVARVVNITSPGHDASSGFPTTTASVSTTAAPRTVHVAMQVPVVMASLGQKISTVALQSLNTGAPLMTSTSPTTATSPKAVIQAIPTVMPASTENGDKVTMRPAKIITIPATQLALCQLQTVKSDWIRKHSHCRNPIDCESSYPCSPWYTCNETISADSAGIWPDFSSYQCSHKGAGG
ncbi:ETS-related transcription factor Elf-2 [Plecturocebus cupreus]